MSARAAFAPCLCWAATSAGHFLGSLGFGIAFELIFGMRFGADVGLADVGQNFVIAVAGNLVGGLLLVTLMRTSQAIGSGETRRPTG